MALEGEGVADGDSDTGLLDALTFFCTRLTTLFSELVASSLDPLLLLLLLLLAATSWRVVVSGVR